MPCALGLVVAEACARNMARAGECNCRLSPIQRPMRAKSVGCRAGSGGFAPNWRPSATSSNSRCMVSLPATISPLGEHGVAAVEVGDEAAGLAHQQDAGRDVPRREVALPIAVEPAGRDQGEIERRRAEAAQPGDLVLDRRRARCRTARDRRGRDAAGRRRSPHRRGACAPRRAAAGR